MVGEVTLSHCGGGEGGFGIEKAGELGDVAFSLVVDGSAYMDLEV